MATAQMAPTEEAPEAEAAEGVTVCISAMPDGSFQVYIKEPATEVQEEGGPDAGDGPQTAGSLKEALQMAGEMLTQEAGEPQDADAVPASKARAVWDQMAATRDQMTGQGQ